MGENSISVTSLDNGKKLSKLQNTFSTNHHLGNYHCSYSAVCSSYQIFKIQHLVCPRNVVQKHALHLSGIQSPICTFQTIKILDIEENLKHIHDPTANFWDLTVTISEHGIRKVSASNPFASMYNLMRSEPNCGPDTMSQAIDLILLSCSHWK